MGISRDKGMLIPEDSEDLPNLFDIFKFKGPVPDSADFAGVDPDLSVSNSEPQELHLLFLELAFGQFEKVGMSL